MTLLPAATREPDGAAQPWNRVVWPHESPISEHSIVFDPASAIRVPAVSRATALYAGMIKQCALDSYRGADPLPRPRLLDRPDPDVARSWFVQVQVEDYLWHGNAIHLVLARTAEGWPSIVRWVPAAWVSIRVERGQVRYFTGGGELPAGDVVHVRRGADRRFPARGIGVVEQHLTTLDRMALEEEYERRNLLGSGVPSVALIANNPKLSQEEADDAKASYVSKYAGPVREPAILPYGTQLIPLSWSPSDSQMVEARKMSLQDVANAFNLDGYWLGAETSSLTYRSPGPMYLGLLRTSLEGVMVDFEQEWGDAWLPRGQAVVFDRLTLTRDDLGSSMTMLKTGIEAGIVDAEEARLYLRMPVTRESAPTVISPVDTTTQTQTQEAAAAEATA